MRGGRRALGGSRACSDRRLARWVWRKGGGRWAETSPIWALGNGPPRARGQPGARSSKTAGLFQGSFGKGIDASGSRYRHVPDAGAPDKTASCIKPKQA